jgi:hypothetical protein
MLARFALDVRGYPLSVALVYFKSKKNGDGTYEGQIGHAYLHPDDEAAEGEEVDLGFVTLTRALEIAAAHGVNLDVDGPTREEWDAAG